MVVSVFGKPDKLCFLGNFKIIALRLRPKAIASFMGGFGKKMRRNGNGEQEEQDACQRPQRDGQVIGLHRQRKQHDTGAKRSGL